MQESTRAHAPRGQGSVYRVGDGWRGSIYVKDQDGASRPPFRLGRHRR